MHEPCTIDPHIHNRGQKMARMRGTRVGEGIVNVRVPREHQLILRAYAARHGVRPSIIVRRAVAALCEAVTAEDPTLLDEAEKLRDTPDDE